MKKIFRNEYFRKNFCIYKKRIRKQKIFAIPLGLFMEQEMELIFIFQPQFLDMQTQPTLMNRTQLYFRRYS